MNVIAGPTGCRTGLLKRLTREPRETNSRAKLEALLVYYMIAEEQESTSSETNSRAKLEALFVFWKKMRQEARNQ